MPYSGRLKKLIELAHRQQIPAYPCVNHFRGPVQMRSVSSNFHALGGDGVYLFNFTRPTGKAILPEWGISDLKSLQEIGSVKTLRGKNKMFLADTGERRNYIGYSNPESPFPVRILGGRAVELFVGDDIRRAKKVGLLTKLELEVDVVHVQPQEGVRIRVNGVSLESKRISRSGKARFTARPPASSLRRGVNKLIFAPGKNSPLSLDAQVTGLRLSVTYKSLQK